MHSGGLTQVCINKVGRSSELEAVRQLDGEFCRTARSLNPKVWKQFLVIVCSSSDPENTIQKEKPCEPIDTKEVLGMNLSQLVI